MKRITIVLGFLFSCLLFSSMACLGQTDTLVLQPGPDVGKDAEIRDDRPNTPVGSGEDFIANAWSYGGGEIYFFQRSLIRFDLTGIPQGAQIVSASLSLHCNVNTSHHQLQSGENQSLLLPILEDWEEDQVTWNNQPGSTYENAVTIPKSSSQIQDYPDIDVTNIVTFWHANPPENFGWLFRLSVEMQYSCMVFASSDNPVKEWRPALTVIYENCTSVADFTYNLQDTYVEFFDQSANAVSWNWDFGDGYSSNLQNPTHAYAEPGNYYCCLAITNPCGNATHCDTVRFCKAPAPHFSYLIDGDAVRFTDSSEMADSWRWDFGDGYFSSLRNPVHAYSKPGNYLCCLTITDTCRSATICDTVFFCKGPSPRFTCAFSGKLVSFHDSTNLADTWFWDFGDGYYSNLHNPQHIFDQFGSYYVCLTATNSCKQENFCDSVRVQVNGIDNVRMNEFVLHPNPAHDLIMLSLPGVLSGQTISLTLMNLQGETVKKTELTFQDPTKEFEIDISDIPCAVYFLEILMNTEIIIKKFIKL